MALSVCDTCGESLTARRSVCPTCGCKLRLGQRMGYGDLFPGLVTVAACVYIGAISVFFLQGVWLLR